MNKVAAFALRRKNSILSMLEKMFCPPQPLRFWITPAYAGKSRMLCKAASQVWDHPRMCGEKSPVSLRFFALVGSPPRMRGKGVGAAHFAGYHGITPAYAGKRHARPDCPHGRRDHPCVCGEKPLVSFVADFSRGSPPRMRGKAPINRHQAEEHGVTPACAGKSAGTGSRSGASWDHPPTVRGKERLAKNQRSVHGITPAYAGKRKVCDGSRHETRDHPRVCGEKIISMLKASFGSGSPPRMRGKGTTTETDK